MIDHDSRVEQFHRLRPSPTGTPPARCAAPPDHQRNAVGGRASTGVSEQFRPTVPAMAIAGLLFMGGMRRSEVSALRWADVAEAAGIERRVTAHSGWVGLASELTSRGASIADVMLAGNWKTSRMVAH